MFSVASLRLSELSIGVSRTSIRYGSTSPRHRVRKMEMAKFPKDHGEKIWVWSHMMTKQVVYSHSEVLESHRALGQIPFNGKKCKPAKLRKDYWEPMAMIQLPKGAGAAGQSVFQKLREFRRMHELCWGDEVLYRSKANDAQPKSEKKGIRNRWERGRALNDQRANAIADIAAVLAGKGRGNRLLVSQEELEDLKKGKKLMGRKWLKLRQWKRLLSSKDAVEVERTEGKSVAELEAAVGEAEAEAVKSASKTEEVSVNGPDGESTAAKSSSTTEVLVESEDGAEVVEVEGSEDQLLPATVYWAVDLDKNYAESWSSNVTHDLLDNAVVLNAEYEKQEVIKEDPVSYGSDDINYKIKDVK